MSVRSSIIDQVIEDLVTIKRNNKKEEYPIDQLIIFLSSSRNIFSYLYWLFVHVHKIDSSKVKEVTDYPLSNWDRTMHECLIKMESKKFPGLISLIVDAVFDYIVSEDRDLVLANFGSGSMEIERQVINKLLKVGFNKKVVFIGFDNSSIVKDVAKNNLVELQNNISLLQEDKLDNRILNSVQKAKNNYIIILCNNNIFNVRKYFKRKSFDLIYHSLFKHHLSEIEKKKLNELTIYLSNQSFEYDGYRSWFQMIPQSIFTWKNPVFLSANIFSNLRFPSKSRIRKENEDIKFNKFGYYLVKHGYFRI